jgi:hypothetical protein
MPEILIKTETYAVSCTISQELADNFFEQLTGGRVITEPKAEIAPPGEQPAAMPEEKTPAKKPLKKKAPSIREKRVRTWLKEHMDENGYIDMTRTAAIKECRGGNDFYSRSNEIIEELGVTFKKGKPGPKRIKEAQDHLELAILVHDILEEISPATSPEIITRMNRDDITMDESTLERLLEGIPDANKNELGQWELEVEEPVDLSKLPPRPDDKLWGAIYDTLKEGPLFVKAIVNKLHEANIITNLPEVMTTLSKLEKNGTVEMVTIDEVRHWRLKDVQDT